MTRHPLLLTALAADILAALLMVGATVIAWRIALRWDPKDVSRAQLGLQTRWETASLAMRWAAGFVFFSTAVLFFVFTNVLPGLVPGAMCGTGVLQAMQTAGTRMLIYRLMALALLWVWWRLESLNQSLPEAPLVPFSARLVLVVLPVMGLALHAFWQAMLAMDLQQPVDCCAVVYDQFRTPEDARRTLGAGIAFWLTVFVTASAAVVVQALAAWKKPLRRRHHLVLGVLVFGWLPIAAVTVVRILSAYHYGVLHHHCPWCFFLPEHALVGFPLWGAWMLAAIEAFTGLVFASYAARQSAVLSAAALRLAGGTARNTLWAMLFFLLLAAGPALWWRARFGMWLTG